MMHYPIQLPTLSPLFASDGNEAINSFMIVMAQTRTCQYLVSLLLGAIPYRRDFKQVQLMPKCELSHRRAEHGHSSQYQPWSSVC